MNLTRAGFSKKPKKFTPEGLKGGDNPPVFTLRRIDSIEASEIQEEYGLMDDELGVGVEVNHVIPNTPADDKGLKVGDAIFELDGKDIGDERTLYRVLSEVKAGQILSGKLLRHENPIDFNLTASIGEGLDMLGIEIKHKKRTMLSYADSIKMHVDVLMLAFGKDGCGWAGVLDEDEDPIPFDMEALEDSIRCLDPMVIIELSNYAQGVLSRQDEKNSGTESLPLSGSEPSPENEENNGTAIIAENESSSSPETATESTE